MIGTERAKPLPRVDGWTDHNKTKDDVGRASEEKGPIDGMMELFLLKTDAYIYTSYLELATVAS